MKKSLLIIGSTNFNNSLNEIKEYLDFSLIFYKKGILLESLISSINSVLVDGDISNNSDFMSVIKSLSNKPILLLQKTVHLNTEQLSYNEKIDLPASLTEINSKITNLIISSKFNKNSSIKIKQFIIDKNEKKLKKGNMSITVTEREIQLIELLFNEVKPISKGIILKKVWNYSDDADTHTIETHIYRLRKKIFNKFKEENFIINLKSGYTI
jgi:DNA-binding response OmpR family regulator